MVKLRLSDCTVEQAYMLNPSWTHMHHILLSSLTWTQPSTHCTQGPPSFSLNTVFSAIASIYEWSSNPD